MLESHDTKIKKGAEESFLCKEFKGHAGTDQIFLKNYLGLDFSKLAFLFSGQGQMTPGMMAEEVKGSSIFKAKFELLDEIAEEEDFGKPSDFILKPSSFDKSRASDYSVLSLYTLQISMFEALLINGYYPAILSAHSFGEFAQLTASGLIDFPDMVRVIMLRQKALREVTGSFSMFAVSNVKKMQTIEIPFEHYEANKNTTLQSSYVCKEQDFPSIQALLKDHRIACVKVNVDYPYHTHWLTGAAELFRTSLQQLNFETGNIKIPFVSSVTGKLVTKADLNDESLRELLVNQFLKPVMFPDQIKTIHSQNIGHFLELSPVDVLTPFVEQVSEVTELRYKTTSFRKKIKKSNTSQKGLGSLKNSKVMGVFNKALKSLSGYSVEDIQLEDRIREDLGIDSIKKAEIVFEIADSISLLDQNNSAPLNLAELATFGDILEYFERSIEGQASDAHLLEEKKINFDLVTKEYIQRPLIDYSSYFQEDQVHIFSTEDIKKAGKAPSVNAGGIFVLHCLNQYQPENMVSECKWWAEIFRDSSIESKRWVFHHDGSVFSAVLSAFLTSYAQEENISYKTIKTETSQVLGKNQYYLENIDFYNNDVKYDKAGQRLSKSYICEEPPTIANTRKYKRVFAFGGLGGLGKGLLLKLKELHQPEVVCIFGRRSKNSEIERQLESLELDSKIEYVCLDVTHSEETLKKINEFEERFGNFDLAIHSVGHEFSRLLRETSSQEIQDTLESKINLAETLKTWSERNTDATVVFNSSVISEFGNIGQAPYAMVNRFLDATAASSKNIISILWPAWEGTGMASDSFIAKSLKLQGLPTIQPKKAANLFQKCLERGQGVYSILGSDFMPDYFAANQSRSETKDLFQTASKNRQIYVLSGLTQDHLPYLKDHLVKRVCLFPASGSIALMLFRAYQEIGHIGNINNFSAHNFLIVGQNSSNYFLESSRTANDVIQLQVRSSQLITETKIKFEEREKNKTVHSFSADYSISAEFDQNIAVYIGPSFKLDQNVYFNSKTDELLLDVDLNQSPEYTGIHILDKFHKLIEASFHSACLKSLLDHSYMVVPKAIDHIYFQNENLDGHVFYPKVGNIKKLENGCECDILTVNSQGKVAFEIKGLRLILVKAYDEQTKILKKIKKQTDVF